MTDQAKFKRIFGNLAVGLTDQRYLVHPCMLAYVTYNVKDDIAKYDFVFTDWNHYSYHPMHHPCEDDTRIKRFIENCKNIDNNASNSVLFIETKQMETIGDFLSKDRKQLVLSAHQELKNISFYVPLIGKMLKDICKEQKTYSSISFAETSSHQFKNLRTQKVKNSIIQAQYELGTALEGLLFGLDEAFSYFIFFCYYSDQHARFLVAGAQAEKCRPMGDYLSNYFKKSSSRWWQKKDARLTKIPLQKNGEMQSETDVSPQADKQADPVAEAAQRLHRGGS